MVETTTSLSSIARYQATRFQVMLDRCTIRINLKSFRATSSILLSGAPSEFFDHFMKELIMALLHAQSAEVIDVRPLGISISDAKTKTLIKTRKFEVIRMVLVAGKEISEHRTKTEFTLQCLEGHLVFSTAEKVIELTAGQMLHLKAGEVHSLKAIENSSLLLTILLRNKRPPIDLPPA